MNKLLYPRLALINIKKNAKFYIPYIITAITACAMFYDMCSMTYNDGIFKLPGSDSIKAMLVMGCYVIGIFSTVFLFYTNSFLIKRRKKEFGLYNVLGMGKRHIAKIMFFESIFISIAGIGLGLVVGIIFDKLITLLLFKILHFEVKLGFYVGTTPIIITVCLFALIFFATLLTNIARVRLSNPTELMKGGNVGEKEPKVKWPLTVIGLISLGVAYYIALTTESPIEALPLFFLAVILVILGTYCLFISGSIALLKLLKKRKNYFYNVKHFNSVSGMIYRMKQNAVGLANICILSTMVLVMISTSVCMYIGTEDALINRYPTDICVTYYFPPEDTDAIKKIDEKINLCVKEKGFTASNKTTVSSISFTVKKIDDNFVTEIDSMATNLHILKFITIDEFNRLTGQNETLKENEIIEYSKGEKLPDSFELFGEQYTVKKHMESFPGTEELSVYITTSHFIAVPDEKELLEVYESQANAYGDDRSLLTTDFSFDIDGTDEQKTEFSNYLSSQMKEQIKQDGEGTIRVESKQGHRSSFYAVYGSFLFLGIFFTILFLMVTVMIMYYKQISEGYDDKDRFAIMQNVGMSKQEVRKTIRSQVLTVFFLPLIASIVHIAFAFKLITRLLILMNLTNEPLFLICTGITVAVFAIIYAAVYLLTARAYYKIVE